MDEQWTIPVAVEGADEQDEIKPVPRFTIDRKDPEQQKLAKLIGWGKVKSLSDQNAIAARHYALNS